MSMNNDLQDFKDLRRLLALKRHEQPPPGYFHHFSGNVISRIRAGEQAPDYAAHSSFAWPWLQRFWNALETKPALAGALGASLCAVMLWAVVSTGNLGTTTIATEPSGPFDLSRAPAEGSMLNGATVSFPSLNGLSAPAHDAFFGGWPPKARLAAFPLTDN